MHIQNRWEESDTTTHPHWNKLINDRFKRLTFGNLLAWSTWTIPVLKFSTLSTANLITKSSPTPTVKTKLSDTLAASLLISPALKNSIRVLVQNTKWSKSWENPLKIHFFTIIDNSVIWRWLISRKLMIFSFSTIFDKIEG